MDSRPQQRSINPVRSFAHRSDALASLLFHANLDHLRLVGRRRSGCPFRTVSHLPRRRSSRLPAPSLSLVRPFPLRFSPCPRRRQSRPPPNWTLSAFPPSAKSAAGTRRTTYEQETVRYAYRRAEATTKTRREQQIWGKVRLC